MEDLWFLGVALACLASFFASLGDNLIKRGHTLRMRRAPEIVPCYRQKEWVAGIFCLVVLNTGLTLLSYSFADASLTIPFSGLHICFNLFLARAINSERYTNPQLWYTTVILIGVMLVLSSGNHNSVQYSISEMEHLFQGTVYVALTMAMVVALSIEGRYAFSRNESISQNVKCLALSLFTGTVGSCTQVFAKVMSESFRDSTGGHGKQVFSKPLAPISIVATLCCAATQLSCLNLALKNFKAIRVVPLVNATMITFGSLYAAVFFKEIDRMNTAKRFVMVFGILVTAVGVFFLSQSSEPDDEEEVRNMNSNLIVDLHPIHPDFNPPNFSLGGVDKDYQRNKTESAAISSNGTNDGEMEIEFDGHHFESPALV